MYWEGGERLKERFMKVGKGRGRADTGGGALERSVTFYASQESESVSAQRCFIIAQAASNARLHAAWLAATLQSTRPFSD